MNRGLLYCCLLSRYQTKAANRELMVSFNENPYQSYGLSTFFDSSLPQCAEPLGGIGCFTTFCCPCFVFCANSEKVDDLGVLYAVLGFVPFGNCISTTLLG